VQDWLIGKMPAANPTDLLLALGSVDPDSQLHAVRNIKNSIIGNLRKKTAFSIAGAVPRLVEILQKSSPTVCDTLHDTLHAGLQIPCAVAIGERVRPEVVVHAVAALGSFAFGSTEGNAAVLAAGAFPVLKRLLYSCDQKVVSGTARTLKILLEGNPQLSQLMFVSEHSSSIHGESNALLEQTVEVPAKDKLDTAIVVRLLELIAEVHEGTSDVAAVVLARACQTRAQQFALSRTRAWEITDILLSSSPKGQEAGLDLAASMVRGNAELAALMLRRPNTNLQTLLRFVGHRRPFMRLLACSCIASTVACGALSVEKNHQEISTVLHTAMKLLFSEPHKGEMQRGNGGREEEGGRERARERERARGRASFSIYGIQQSIA
jgi:hypothetical protein